MQLPVSSDMLSHTLNLNNGTTAAAAVAVVVVHTPYICSTSEVSSTLSLLPSTFIHSSSSSSSSADSIVRSQQLHELLEAQVQEQEESPRFSHLLGGAQEAAQTGVGRLVGCSMNFQEDSDDEKKPKSVKDNKMLTGKYDMSVLREIARVEEAALEELVELYEVDDEDELSELGVEFDIHELIDMSPDERSDGYTITAALAQLREAEM
eukprot:20717-Heterococcus_DN1.PRE.2